MDYTKIIDSYRYKCKKLCFDTERIKNKEKIYLKYNILEGEKIIAFQKSKIPFLGLAIDGTIFTNNAVYMQPYNEKESVNKVLYKNICQYLIVQEHSKAEAVLCSRTKVLQLASSTLFGSNIAGEEMAEILKSIQIEQMRNDPDAVNYYDRVVEWVLDSARNCMKENELSESLVAKLEAIHNFNNYQERGLELQAENIYRSFELGKYENFISEKGIDDKKNTYENNFLNDLSSIENVFNEKYLEKVNRNICEYTIEKGEYREINLIKGYIAVRIRLDYEKINSTLCIDDQNQLLVFKGRFYNKQMADVYNLLISGEVTRIDNTDIVDSMGLSPLHYAFVLKEKDICNELLETGKWYDYEAPYQSGELKEIYNYLVVADLLEYEDLAYVFRFTSREAQSIMDTCQKIDIRIRVKEERIKGKKEAIKASKYKANEARKADDRETYERAIERIEELEDDINSTEELVREWQEELENLNTELELITENAIANAKEWKERLVNSQTSMVQFLLKMFFDKDFLFQCISGEDAGWAVYEFEKFRFILPKDIKFWERDAKAKKENYEQKENNKTVKKPYGDSWFSVEAHWDLKILKKEYRKLIKEYHPDNGSINQFIIQEIILEKAEILKNIEN